MNYEYHPWIEKIEYTFRDFAELFALYATVAIAAIWYWDKNVYERYVNESRTN
tara:strand:- start:941 stop:1099 length:159 start_codon:yes stop_codon:yes gene_type:complete